jgi:hypothetical protein
MEGKVGTDATQRYSLNLSRTRGVFHIVKRPHETYCGIRAHGSGYERAGVDHWLRGSTRDYPITVCRRCEAFAQKTIPCPFPQCRYPAKLTCRTCGRAICLHHASARDGRVASCSSCWNAEVTR